MQKSLFFLGAVLAATTITGTAAAQYPYPAPPPPPPPQGGYGYAPAYAPRPPQVFGGPGTLAISSDMNLGWYGESVSNNGGSGWTFILAPAVDYFVIQGLSLGGQISYEHDHTSNPGVNGAASTTTDSNAFGIGPRVGYNIPINDLLSFWPKVSLIFSDTAEKDASHNNFDVKLYAPLLLHLAPHFFAGLGPGIQTDLTSSASSKGQSENNPAKVTQYGLYFTIGGWTVPAG